MPTQTPPTIFRFIAPLSALLLALSGLAAAPAPAQAASQPDPRAAITADSLAALAPAGQWGRGVIVDVAFAPDGRAFVVGSPLGLAVYTLDHPDQPPRWLPFPAPYWYDHLGISQDGSRVRLEAGRTYQEIVLADGHWEPARTRQTWLHPAEWALGSYALVVNAPDGRLQFRSQRQYVPDSADLEMAVREVRDRQTRQTLYTFTDPAPYISLLATSEPEGCEISHFSWCGNAWTPSLAAPEAAAFSPDGQNLAVLYQLSYSGRYSGLRVYAAADGGLRRMFGGETHPVAAFAFAPDSRRLLVAYTDGAVQLWDLEAGRLTFSAWHFNGWAGALAYTADGRYLLVERAGGVEIRRRSDGALRGRYAAETFAAAPAGDLVALGGTDGVITLLAAGSGQVVRQIEAHRDRIFALAFSPDGRWLASSSQDCTIRLWDTATGAFLHLFEQTIVNAYDEPGLESRIFIRGLWFVPGGRQLLGFGSWGTAVSWDVNSGARLYVVASAPLESYDGMVTLNPHFPEFFGADVAAGRFYINQQAYDLTTGRPAGEFQRPAGLPAGCAAAGPHSADDRLLFTVGRQERAGQICVLDAQDLHLIRTLTAFPAAADAALGWLYLSPDGGQLAATGPAGEVYLFEAAAD